MDHFKAVIDDNTYTFNKINIDGIDDDNIKDDDDKDISDNDDSNDLTTLTTTMT